MLRPAGFYTLDLILCAFENIQFLSLNLKKYMKVYFIICVGGLPGIVPDNATPWMSLKERIRILDILLRLVDYMFDFHYPSNPLHTFS